MQPWKEPQSHRQRDLENRGNRIDKTLYIIYMLYYILYIIYHIYICTYIKRHLYRHASLLFYCCGGMQQGTGSRPSEAKGDRDRDGRGKERETERSRERQRERWKRQGEGATRNREGRLAIQPAAPPFVAADKRLIMLLYLYVFVHPDVQRESL